MDREDLIKELKQNIISEAEKRTNVLIKYLRETENEEELQEIVRRLDIMYIVKNMMALDDIFMQYYPNTNNFVFLDKEIQYLYSDVRGCLFELENFLYNMIDDVTDLIPDTLLHYNIISIIGMTIFEKDK